MKIPEEVKFGAVVIGFVTSIIIGFFCLFYFITWAEAYLQKFSREINIQYGNRKAE